MAMQAVDYSIFDKVLPGKTINTLKSFLESIEGGSIPEKLANYFGDTEKYREFESWEDAKAFFASEVKESGARISVEGFSRMFKALLDVANIDADELLKGNLKQRNSNRLSFAEIEPLSTLNSTIINNIINKKAESPDVIEAIDIAAREGEYRSWGNFISSRSRVENNSGKNWQAIKYMFDVRGINVNEIARGEWDGHQDELLPTNEIPEVSRRQAAIALEVIDIVVGKHGDMDLGALREAISEIAAVDAQISGKTPAKEKPKERG